MTRDEILQVGAGYELDRFIANKVMGWQETSDAIYETRLDKSFVVAVDDFDVCDGKRRVFLQSKWRGEAWRWEPSINIADAWDIINKMIEDGTFINLGHGGLVWRVNISTRHLYERLEFMSVTAETAPLSICRAALIATLEDE